MDALANGTPPAAVNDRLRTLDARRVTLERDLAAAVAPAPRLHPNLAEVYRQKVAGLIEMLARDDAVAIREEVRSLIETIVLTPAEGVLRVEIRGALAAILALASAANGKSAGVGADALGVQIKMVAGIGFEPMTFRL